MHCRPVDSDVSLELTADASYNIIATASARQNVTCTATDNDGLSATESTEVTIVSCNYLLDSISFKYNISP